MTGQSDMMSKAFCRYLNMFDADGTLSSLTKWAFEEPAVQDSNIIVELFNRDRYTVDTVLGS